MAKDFKELSKGNFGIFDNQSGPNNEQIQTGCLQRIADATEKIAVNYDALLQAKNTAEKQRDDYWAYYQNEKKNVAALERSNTALRGVITKMKNKQK